MRALAIASIDWYKRHLSPRKGYSCAYRVYHGRHSCSTFARRVIARKGVLYGLAILPHRFRACSEALAAMQADILNPDNCAAGSHLFRQLMEPSAAPVPPCGPVCSCTDCCSCWGWVDIAKFCGSNGSSCCASLPKLLNMEAGRR